MTSCNQAPITMDAEMQKAKHNLAVELTIILIILTAIMLGLLIYYITK